MDTLFSMDAVEFGYAKDQTVLDGISLDIAPGTMNCLVGRNGSGKSTLLSLSIGRFRPRAGTIRLCGGAPSNWRSRERVGYMPQGASFPPMLKVGFVLDMVANYKQTSVAGESIVDRMGLRDHVGERCGALSGGWARRLALCCALMGSPRLLILDEPTVGIDVACRTDVLNTIADFVADDGAVLWTTHIAEDAFAVDSDLLILQNGACRNFGAFRSANSAVDVAIVEVVSRSPLGIIHGISPHRVGATWRYAVPAAQQSKVIEGLAELGLNPEVVQPTAEDILVHVLEEEEQ